MTDLIELLPSVEGNDHIERCWGYVPPYRWGDLLHVRPSGAWHEQTFVLTAVFWTDGPENINECRPSRLVVEFDGVVYWEHGSCLVRENGIRLGELLASPPSGTIAVHLQHEFHVVCRTLRVMSCIRESYNEAD
jgi:hypothetical protein